jgi:L-amino acid N-acyltransferase YncA
MTGGAVQVREAIPADAAALAAIYNHYVEHTVVTFEEAPLSAAEMASRMMDIATAALPWLVAVDDHAVVGYAYAMKWRLRSAYRFSVEVTVYLAPDVVGRGAGTMLYAALFTELERCGVHAVIGGIALPNAPSIRLHEKFGMQKVAHFREVGFKFGQWVDVGYWQRVLTR